MNPSRGDVAMSISRAIRVAPSPTGSSRVRTSTVSGPPDPPMTRIDGGRSCLTDPVTSAPAAAPDSLRCTRLPLASGVSISVASTTSGSQRGRSSIRVATRNTRSGGYGSSIDAPTRPMAESYASCGYFAGVRRRARARVPARMAPGLGSGTGWRIANSRARSARATRPASTRPFTDAGG